MNHLPNILHIYLHYCKIKVKGKGTIAREDLYSLFIRELIFINFCIEECSNDKNYDPLLDITKNLVNIIDANSKEEKIIKSANFLKNLFILYLYFSNYPFVYGLLNDEEIDDFLSIIKPDLNFIELVLMYNLVLNQVINVVEEVALFIEQGIPIFREKEKLIILQKNLIFHNFLKIQMDGKMNASDLKQYYQIKFYFKDIDFCLCKAIFDIFKDLGNNYTEIIYSFLKIDKRFLLYLEYQTQILRQRNNNNENEQAKAYNKAIKFNDTIVLGNEQFHNLIKKINLPCKNIYYLNDYEFAKFFLVPKKINDKYKICKYFIIMNERRGKKYIETIRYISCIFGIKLAVIIYVQNKDIKIDKKILENPFIHIVFTYSKKNILDYYDDTFNRLKDLTVNYGNEIEQMSKEIFDVNYYFPKINETKIFREQDNGWDMVKDININIFNLTKIIQTGGFIDGTSLHINMFKAYKENNCLDLFINYYGNFLAGEYLVEQIVSTLCTIKLFLYAYTLEEDNGKSFYCIMNNEFRSGNFQKISRYLPMIRYIYEMIKKKHLYSYCGDVYRAAKFENSLINEIKEGKKMLNTCLWSSSKKLDVAKRFLFDYNKNILIHTKIKEGGNIDIHSEKISKYPNEEEVLILPFSFFEVKRFKKNRVNNFEYYDLELIYCEEENKINKIDNVGIKELNMFNKI